MNMTPEKFDGFLLGLLIAAYICEAKAGNRASANAMTIMQYRNHAVMFNNAGRELPSWMLS